MAHSLRSDHPLGVELAAPVAAGAVSDVRATTVEVARVATSLHSSVARFRY